MKEHKWIQGLLIISLLAIILPALWLIQYTHLRLDDFCRFDSSFTNYLFNIQSWYFTLNGRYINSLLSHLPVYNLSVYRCILLFLLIGFSLSSYNFFKKIFSLFGVKQDSLSIVLLSLFFLVVILSILPSIDEFFYWYAAASVYQVSAIFFMFFLIHILEFWIYDKTNFYVLAILIIILNGNSELLLGVTNFLLLLLLLKDLYYKKCLKLSLIILNMLSWLSSLIMINAPGMSLRRSMYDNGGDLLVSAKVALIYGTKFIALSLADPLVILFIVFLFLFVRNIKIGSEIQHRRINPIILGLVSYICILSMVFIIFYATGSFFSYNTGRAGNLLLVVLMLFVIINLINIIFYYNLPWIDYRISYIVAILFFGMIFFSENNTQRLFRDMIYSENRKYADDFEQRQRSIVQQEGDLLILKPIKDTRILKSGTNNLKRQSWVRGCYLDYVNMKYNKHFKTLKFKALSN